MILRRRLPLLTVVVSAAVALTVGAGSSWANKKHHHHHSSHKKPTSMLSLSGQWSGQYSGAYSGTFKLNWTQTGSSLKGTIAISSPPANLGVNGTLTGNVIKFGTVGSAAITYTGTVSGKSMSGSYKTPTGGGSWSATEP